VNPKGDRKITRDGFFVAERVLIQLYGEEEERFKRDRTGYLTEFLKSEGFEVREVKSEGIELHEGEPPPGSASEGDLWFRYAHIVWDVDRRAICMWTPY
jgi:hypothetical protein